MPKARRTCTYIYGVKNMSRYTYAVCNPASLLPPILQTCLCPRLIRWRRRGAIELGPTSRQRQAHTFLGIVQIKAGSEATVVA